MEEKNNGINFNIELFNQKLGFSLSDNTVNKIAAGTSTLFAPAIAWLKGEEARRTVRYLPFYDTLAERKNENIKKLLIEVLKDLKEREENLEKIPDNFSDTDNLLLIQDNASTTSNEDFLKIWAKFYTEEACNSGTVSRKTIKLLETIDINIVKILENDIFPFCDNLGFYWGSPQRLTQLIIAQDYGIIDYKNISKHCTSLNESACIKLNNSCFLRIYPSLKFSPKTEYILTKSGLEIKNILKINAQGDQLEEIFAEIKDSSSSWTIADSFSENVSFQTNLQNDQKFIICNDTGQIIYPKNKIYKTFDEFYQNAISNIEVINEN